MKWNASKIKVFFLDELHSMFIKSKSDKFSFELKRSDSLSEWCWWMTDSYTECARHTHTHTSPKHQHKSHSLVALLRPCLSLSGVFAPPGWACLSVAPTSSTLQHNTHTHTHTHSNTCKMSEKKGEREWKDKTSTKKLTIKAAVFALCLCMCTLVCR